MRSEVKVQSCALNRIVGRNKDFVLLVSLHSFKGSTAPVGLGILIVEVSRSCSVRQATFSRIPLDE